MRVIATRGVCVGVNRHLKVGDIAEDLDTATVQFLKSIKAVEEYVEPATEVVTEAAAQVQGGFQEIHQFTDADKDKDSQSKEEV